MEEQRVLKIILLGNSNAGKTTLITSFLYGHPIIPKKPVLFGSFYKEIEINQRTFRVSICDTSGSNEFTRLQEMSFLDAHLIVLCVDSNNRSSLLNSEECLKDLKNVKIPVILCLTKCDLSRAVLSSEIDSFISKYRIDSYIETKGNDNRDVRRSFEKMILIAEEGKEQSIQYYYNFFRCC